MSATTSSRLIPAARAAGIVMLLAAPSVQKMRLRILRWRTMLHAEESAVLMRIDSADSVMTSIATALLELSSDRRG